MDDELLARWRRERAPHTPAAPPWAKPAASAGGLDATVAGRAPWDRPSAAWDDLRVVDDRGAGPRASHDPMPTIEPPPAPIHPPRPAGGGASMSASGAPAADPYDADAPVLGDVRPVPAASRPSWPQRPALAGSPVTPPSLAGRSIGPTPPDDLFAPGNQAPATQHQAFAPSAAGSPATLDLWSQPTPAAWRPPASSPDPLASLPAATVAPTELPPIFAPPETPVAAPRPAADDLGLWSVAATPPDLERITAERAESPEAAESDEPSSLLTLALTLLIAVLVMGLVLAFVWQMTSLPILR